MGTNYYLHKRNDTCPTCGHREDATHIGKSSVGWCFTLHVYPDMGINDLPDWQARWSAEDAIIRNEYGNEVSAEEMFKCVTERSAHSKHPWGSPELARNSAILGPRNLARHRLDRFCIKHGDGTWDCCVGDFS